MAFGLTGEQAEPRLSYGSYLKVPELLQLQKTLADPPQHDELLFIIIHQIHELWFRQLLHEVDAVIARLDDDDVLAAHRLIRRCIEIQRVLVEQVNVLETMTPNDFLTFRDHLMPASGFQSVQFRELEFVCGLKNPRQLENYAEGSAERAALEARLEGSTLGERFHALLTRRGFDVGAESDRPSPAPGRSEPASAHATTDFERNLHERRTRALLRIYHDPSSHYDLYLLAEALIEFDEMFYLWRLRHIAMVERMIGSKPGTGGSDGVSYLRATLARKFFPELWELRTHLGANPA